jgi:Tat protein translocase TatB subunit
MLGIGMTEMLIIAAVALVVMGPEKFPDFAKVVMRTFRDFRGYMDEAKREITKEIVPVQKELNSLSRYDPEAYLNAMTSEGSSGEKKHTPANTDYAPGQMETEADHLQPGTDTTGVVQDDRPQDDPYYDTYGPKESDAEKGGGSPEANAENPSETTPKDPGDHTIVEPDPAQGIEPPERLDG